MHTCSNCGRSFPSELDLELHRDGCVEETLVCRSCGAQFPEARATTDGWHYECPNPDCDASGIGDGLRRLGDSVLTVTR